MNENEEQDILYYSFKNFKNLFNSYKNKFDFKKIFIIENYYLNL